MGLLGKGSDELAHFDRFNSGAFLLVLPGVIQLYDTLFLQITKMPIVKYFISSKLHLPFPPPKRYRFNSFALSKFLSDCPYVYGPNNNYPQLTVLPTPTVIWITQSRAKRQGSQSVDWRAKRSLCTVKLKLKCCSYVISLRVFV